MQTEIVKGVAAFLIPVNFWISIFFLFRGHNLPGGGFIAGLILASAFTMSELVFNKRTFLNKNISPMSLIKLGLSCSIIAGLWGWFQEGLFLQGIWTFEIWLPILGKIKTGSVLLFDLGVYFLVAGFMTTLVYSLKEMEE